MQHETDDVILYIHSVHMINTEGILLNFKITRSVSVSMNTLKIPILALIQREREHLLMVSESRFEALNGGSANYIFLQVVSL